MPNSQKNNCDEDKFSMKLQAYICTKKDSIAVAFQ